MNLLTLPEAAGQLAVSRRTLERLIQTGVLPCIRLGRSVRIDPMDLAAMLEGVKTRACLEEKPACRSLNAALSPTK